MIIQQNQTIPPVRYHEERALSLLITLPYDALGIDKTRQKSSDGQSTLFQAMQQENIHSKNLNKHLLIPHKNRNNPSNKNCLYALVQKLTLDFIFNQPIYLDFQKNSP